MNIATQVQILDKAVCISRIANNLEKRMHFTSSYEWILGQNGFLNFGMAAGLGEGTLN